jgi:hypothetical protein
MFLKKSYRNPKSVKANTPSAKKRICLAVINRHYLAEILRPMAQKHTSHYAACPLAFNSFNKIITSESSIWLKFW